MDAIGKLLARIPTKHRRQILDALECLADPSCRPTLHAEKLSGSSALQRIRVSRYRIVFHVDGSNKAIVDLIRLRNERTYRDV